MIYPVIRNPSVRVPVALMVFAALLFYSQTPAFAVDKSDPQKPSPLVAQTFVIYYMTPGNNTVAAQEHRTVLVFGADGAKSSIFPGNATIPFTATVKTKQTGGRRKQVVITEFSAQGEAPQGKGTVSFTAAKDGVGAKGTVTLTEPGKPPITMTFIGSPS